MVVSSYHEAKSTVGTRRSGRLLGRTTLVHNSLLQRVARGEAEAVRECIDRYGGLVWSLARRFTSGDADAEDAVQEIFVNLWRSADRFDPSVASETTFVAMIARRRLIDRARSRGRQPTVEVMTEVNAPPIPTRGDATETADDAAQASVALAKLAPDQQRVLRLSVYQGLSHEQIAQATGLPLGTVKTHIRRGLIRIRELLESDKPGNGHRSSTEGMPA